MRKPKSTDQLKYNNKVKKQNTLQMILKEEKKWQKRIDYKRKKLEK